jgi:hypothetical protein
MVIRNGKKDKRVDNYEWLKRVRKTRVGSNALTVVPANDES